VFDLSILKLSALTALGLAALFGLYFGQGARRIRLPSIIGYMILGVILGPSVLNIFGESMAEQLSFITQIALGLVAFGIGAELDLGSLRRLGTGIVSIILAESFGAFIVVTGAVFLLTRDLPMALIFGAMAPASAPAGTVAVIHEYRAKGSLTKALYAVVGFDDGLAIIIFGFAAAAARSALLSGTAGAVSGIGPAVLGPLREIGLSLAIGVVVGLLFTLLVRRLRESGQMLILIFGCVLLATGISVRWNLSLILTNMAVGFVLANTRRQAFVHRVLGSHQEIMPLTFVLFFCLAGAHLEIAALPALGLVGGVYFLARSAGLIGGAWVGSVLGHVESKIKKYIGLGILSQAGVAIGLSLIVSHDFAQLGRQYNIPDAARIGAAVLTTVAATSIFFEIVGPILTRFALRRAGEIESPGDKPVKPDEGSKVDQDG
jgi:Kef-type K+ transport system membrane component KefB